MTHCHVTRRNFKFHPSEWTQKAPFPVWFRRFVQFTKLAQQKPILLLWHGHSTHKKNTKLTDTERKNNLARLCFPHHCTHRLQQFRVSSWSPSTLLLRKECARPHTHPGRANPVRCETLQRRLYGSGISIEGAKTAFRKTTRS